MYIVLFFLKTRSKIHLDSKILLPFYQLDIGYTVSFRGERIRRYHFFPLYYICNHFFSLSKSILAAFIEKCMIAFSLACPAFEVPDFCCFSINRYEAFVKFFYSILYYFRRDMRSSLLFVIYTLLLISSDHFYREMRKVRTKKEKKKKKEKKTKKRKKKICDANWTQYETSLLSRELVKSLREGILCAIVQVEEEEEESIDSFPFFPF